MPPMKSDGGRRRNNTFSPLAITAPTTSCCTPSPRASEASCVDSTGPIMRVILSGRGGGWSVERTPTTRTAGLRLSAGSGWARSCRGSVGLEQGAYRLAFVDAADRLGERRRHRQDGELVVV